MGDNLRIRKLQKDIINTLNESNLPFEVLLLVIEKLYVEVKQKADEAVRNEIEELKAEEAKKQQESQNNNTEKADEQEDNQAQ